MEALEAPEAQPRTNNAAAEIVHVVAAVPIVILYGLQGIMLQKRQG